MSCMDDNGESLLYGEADYVKARKVLNNPASNKLLRDRINPYSCHLGKPVMYWFDFWWEKDVAIIKAYLDTYDVVQEVNIDAILDFMPKEHMVYEWDGEEICKRDGVRDLIVDWLSNERGILGYFQDKIDRMTESSYSLAQAKAFNKLCRDEATERTNNAIIAEHILVEGLEPEEDSVYKEALSELHRALDTGTSWFDDIEIFHLPDYREAKGLLIEAQAPTVKPAVLHFPVQW